MWIYNSQSRKLSKFFYKIAHIYLIVPNHDMFILLFFYFLTLTCQYFYLCHMISSSLLCCFTSLLFSRFYVKKCFRILRILAFIFEMLSSTTLILHSGYVGIFKFQIFTYINIYFCKLLLRLVCINLCYFELFFIAVYQICVWCHIFKTNLTLVCWWFWLIFDLSII